MKSFPFMLGGLLLACAGTALAHKASDSYLQLKVEGSEITGQWDLALRDLHTLVDLDANGDGNITWGELKSAQVPVQTVLKQYLRLNSGSAFCPLSFTRLQVDEHSDGAYAVLDLRASCPEEVETLGVDYSLLFEQDPTHRGLLRLDFGAARSAVFGPQVRAQRFARADAGSWTSLGQYVREGAVHVWSGWDHLLFLATLLLPAVLRREGHRWIVSESARQSFTQILIVISAFTLAHAATLTLVLLERVEVPSRWVESLVAATVAFAAINNLYPLVRQRLWLLSFGFGLIHGAAIASVLAALDLAKTNLALALLGFNLGVEGGQLLVVAAWLPLAFALRRTRLYQWGIVTIGSTAVLAVALIWLVERVTAS